MLASFANRDFRAAWGDPREMAAVRERILEEKPVLRELMASYCRDIESFAIPEGVSLELGSGGGFLKKYLPHVITSDIAPLRNVDVVCDGTRLPFGDKTLSNIVLREVLPHIDDPVGLFRECERTLRDRGRIIISDPYVTPFSYFVNKYLHSEPCDPNADWRSDSGRPRAGCNLARATIIFKKRLAEFKARFPSLRIRHTKHHTFFIYLLSGGYSYPSLIPRWMFGIAMGLEKLLAPLRMLLANAIFVVIEKCPSES